LYKVTIYHDPVDSSYLPLQSPPNLKFLKILKKVLINEKKKNTFHSDLKYIVKNNQEGKQSVFSQLSGRVELLDNRKRWVFDSKYMYT